LGPLVIAAQPSVMVHLTSLQFLLHILQNAASAGAAVLVNAASMSKLSAVDRQRNYVDRMSTATRQQQQNHNCE